jgi:hypothetical protein
MSGRFESDLHAIKVSEPGGLGRAFWRLSSPLVYTSAIVGRVVIPDGFETDFASVPRLPLAHLLTGDTAHASAVVHDYLVDIAPWRLAADVFREAMAAEGVPGWRQWMMYWAVRLAKPPGKP